MVKLNQAEQVRAEVDQAKDKEEAQKVFRIENYGKSNSDFLSFDYHKSLPLKCMGGAGYKAFKMKIK